MLSLGQELRRLREARGLTQDHVAKSVGHAKPGKVSLWENDERRPSRANIVRLADILGTTVEHLRQYGQAYDPTAPRLTRRQRALVEEAVKATTPLEEQVAALDAATRGMPTAAVQQHFTELMTDGPEMLRLVGPLGMAAVWRLVGIIDRHKSDRDAMLARISAAFDAIEAELTPDNHQRQKHA